MSSKPCVLVLSHTNTKPKSLLKLITKSSSSVDESSTVVKYDWFIDSKYYTADITFAGIEQDFDRTEEFNHSVEGLIISFDPNKETGLKDLKLWDVIQNDCDPDVKILVANYCDEETTITRTKAIEWCLKRGFELIELYPKQNNSNDHKLDKNEKVGVERIIEALHSHTWSNLVLKNESKKVSTNGKISVKPDEASINDIAASEDFSETSLDDFTDLFSQLHIMRESLCSLPANQRKQCAEQMVTAFWKAIGGDEDELFDV